MKKSLFEISNEYTQAIEELENYCLENNTDELPEGINERLVINQDELNDKLKNYWFVITELNGNLDAIKAHQKVMAAKKKAIENNINRLKSYVGDALELYGEENKTGNKFYKHDLFKVTASRSNKLLINDIDSIPEQYKEIVITETVKVDNKQLKIDLNNNLTIEGAIIDDSTINVTFR